MKEHAETLVNGNTWNPNQFQDVLDAKTTRKPLKLCIRIHMQPMLIIQN